MTANLTFSALWRIACKRQSVQFSLQNLTRVEITNGLSEGDKVAVPAEESKPLVDGATIKIVP